MLPQNSRRPLFSKQYPPKRSEKSPFLSSQTNTLYSPQWNLSSSLSKSLAACPLQISPPHSAKQPSPKSNSSVSLSSQTSLASTTLQVVEKRYPPTARQPPFLQLPAPSHSHLQLAFLSPSKNIFQRPGKRPSSWLPRSSNCLQLFADSLDTCRPLIGLQKHYSDSMMANQGLTSGCLGSRHLAKQAAAKQAPHGGLHIRIMFAFFLSAT